MSGGLRWTAEQFEQHQAKIRSGAGAVNGASRVSSLTRDVSGPTAPAPSSKYRSRIVIVDNIRFQSILEADRYLEFKLLKQAGTVRLVLRQVPFYLPGGVCYRADFMALYDDQRLEFEDTKGFDKQEAINKRKQVLELYGIEIKVLRRKQVSRQVSA